MNILAIDTSLAACSAAVLISGVAGIGDTGKGVSSERLRGSDDVGAEGPGGSEGWEKAQGAVETFQIYEEMRRGHGERIVPMIGEVMGEAGLGFEALDRIAVTLGPGTFTGVRVGLAAARGLALASGRPLFGEVSLRVMAARYLMRVGAAGDAPPARLVVAVDARRGQVYFQIFDRSAGPLCGPEVLDPSQAAARLRPTDTVIASGAAMVVAALRAAQGTDQATPRIAAEQLEPDGRTLGMLVREMDADAAQAHPRPLYLRPPDAVPPKEAAVTLKV